MARFDVYADTAYADYVIDIQSDYLSGLHSRMVIPVMSKKRIRERIPKLHVPIEIQGKPFYAITNMMGAIPRSRLGKPVGNVADHAHEITGAIDFLLQGF